MNARQTQYSEHTVHSLNIEILLLKTIPESQFLVNTRYPNLLYLLTLTCSFHFWNLHRVNFRFSVGSKRVIRVYYEHCSFFCGDLTFPYQTAGVTLQRSMGFTAR